MIISCNTCVYKELRCNMNKARSKEDRKFSMECMTTGHCEYPYERFSQSHYSHWKPVSLIEEDLFEL